MVERKGTTIKTFFILVFLTTNLFGYLSAFSVKITVEGGCGSTYSIGDELIFSVNLSEGAYVTIWVVTPDDERNITKDTYKRKGTHSFSGIVSGPEGTHSLHVEARNRYGETVSDSCSYIVVSPLDSDDDGVIDSSDDCNNPDCDIVDASGCPVDSDNDGVDDCDDDCNNSDCDIVDASGCPVDSDNDGIDDCDDDCPNEEGDSSNNGCPRPQSSTPPLTPSQETTLFRASAEGPMVYVVLFLIAAAIILFLIYRSISMKRPESRVKKERPEGPSREPQELRKKLDEDYVEDRISREEYLRRKKELESE